VGVGRSTTIKESQLTALIFVNDMTSFPRDGQQGEVIIVLGGM
jgi:hypothetical protein